MAGELALSCAGQEGRPCGQGAGAAAELDAAAGHGGSAAGAVRLVARTGRGSDRNTALAVERAHLDLALGPLGVELGRDVLALDPAAHTQLGWSSNPPPLDHLRLSTTRPLAVSQHLTARARYVLGRLAAPQTYPGDLVSIARAQLELDGWLAIGATQLLQLGGDGAPRLGVLDFVLEHVRRRDASAGASDSSNRRVGLDFAAQIDGFGGARISYQLMFEDLRTRIADALRHDADHVLGFETRWLTVEWHRTGVRSYEHTPRTTGFTSDGRIAGDPLGPDAEAVYVAGRIAARTAVVVPWAEFAVLGSDTYRFEDEAIVVTGRRPAELRLRLGAAIRLALGHGLALAPEAAVEDVERTAFVPGARRVNALARAVLEWRPP